MNHDELVSIITPSYNTEKYIIETIKSVQAQSYTNWEMIIVDDCSTDNTLMVVREYLTKNNEKRVKLLVNKKNSGAAISRNYALREAKGKWIAFLDSDDLWLPEKLEKQINFMKENDYHFTYTNYEEINSEGKKTGILVTGPKRITKAGMYNYCWPGCLTVMYDVEKIGLVQIEDIKKNNDYAMWLKVCKKCNCMLLYETLAKYRKGRKNSISAHSSIIMLGWHYKLFRECEKLSIFSCVLYTLRNVIFGLYKKGRYVKNAN